MFGRFKDRVRRRQRARKADAMLRRLTDRALIVMDLADQEARQSHLGYVGTEHILLGLAGEGEAVGATVLRKFGADLSTLRTAVAKLVRPGPDTVPMAGRLPQTPRARKAVEYAVEEAWALRHNYVGTEHLLLGLLQATDGIAARALVNLGLNLEDIRRTVLTMLGVDTPGDPVPERRVKQPGEADYRSLDVWKKADELAHTIYRVAGGFPEDAHEVGSHLRRAALLLPPNIAEAYRQPDKAEAKWFLSITLGLLQELRYGLDFSMTLEYVRSEEHEMLASLAGQIDAELRRYHDTLTREE